MTTQAPTAYSPIRLLFWRLAARLTELALRHRLGMLAAWPYVQLAGGAMTAYLLGRLVGAWAMNAVP